MRKDKEYIFKLRQEGKSFRQIQKETGVSRGTLASWFKYIQWSKHLSRDHTEKMPARSKENMTRMNMVRKLNLQFLYALKESEATKEYEIYKLEPLFWAGLMFYAGEGDIRNKYAIKANSDIPYKQRIFIRFLTTYLSLSASDLRFCLYVQNNVDTEKAKEYWSNELFANPQQFHKTQIIKGKATNKRLQYGICVTIITNVALKKKLLKWLELAEKQEF
jgi:hypothetical protein